MLGYTVPHIRCDYVYVYFEAISYSFQILISEPVIKHFDYRNIFNDTLLTSICTHLQSQEKRICQSY